MHELVNNGQSQPLGEQFAACSLLALRMSRVKGILCEHFVYTILLKRVYLPDYRNYNCTMYRNKAGHQCTVKQLHLFCYIELPPVRLQPTTHCTTYMHVYYNYNNGTGHTRFLVVSCKSKIHACAIGV